MSRVVLSSSVTVWGHAGESGDLVSDQSPPIKSRVISRAVKTYVDMLDAGEAPTPERFAGLFGELSAPILERLVKVLEVYKRLKDQS